MKVYIKSSLLTSDIISFDFFDFFELFLFRSSLLGKNNKMDPKSIFTFFDVFSFFSFYASHHSHLIRSYSASMSA